VKRTALLLITAIYLLSLLGIGVNRFYCCGKLASVTLTYAASEHNDKDKCCKNESKSFKLKDSHVTVKTIVLNPAMPALLPTPVYQAAVIRIAEEIVHTGYHSNAPPGNSEIPIYTLHCAYRI
jgi:hypothetical protein